MIKRLLIFFLILSFHSVAQDYRVIVPSQAQFFQTTNSGWLSLGLNSLSWSPIKVAYFDSSVVTGNGTEYFTFHTWRDTGQDCAEEKGPSWIGSHVIELNNGMNYFFNVAGDTIRIRSNAVVTDSWNLFDDVNGDYIVAYVDSLVWMQQAGIQDSVKYISLLAYDSFGTVISNHPVNGQSLLLSKSNGFFRTTAFREFPSNLTFLDQRPPIPMPTQAQVFDLDVNDEFEFSGYCYDMFHVPLPPHYSYYKILSKSFSANLDTVIYHRQVITLNMSYNPVPTPHIDSIVFVRVDSVRYPYNNIPFFSTYPEENNYPSDSSELENYVLSQDSTILCNSSVYSVTTGFMSYQSWDSCYGLNHFEPVFYTSQFAPGLAQVYFESNLFAIAQPQCLDGLFWYHKGIQTCGTFINLINGLAEELSPASFTIFPNPVTDYCHVVLSRPFHGKLFLFDVTGRIVMEKVVVGISVDLDLTTTPAGMYILSFVGESGVFNKKIIKE